MIFRRILKRMDYLAPSIGLHYNGSGKHYSKVSHTISLISIIVTLLSIIYFIRPFLLKKNPTTSVNEELLKKGENLYINPTSFFHFIWMVNLNGSSSNVDYVFDFDFDSFRVIGIEEEIIFYNHDLETINHWVYGTCDPNTDFEIVKDLNDYQYIELISDNLLCIKKYYSAETEKYYDVNSKGFRWPRIKSKFFNSEEEDEQYSIIIEKCQQDTLELIKGEGYSCNSDLEIYNKISTGSLNIILNFLDYYIDLDDYDEPEKKYLAEISDYMDNEFYPRNLITLSHLTLKTSKGIFFNRSHKKNIYDYDNNEKIINHQNDFNKDIYNTFTFKLSNIKKIYSRKYKNLIDIFSNIGGFSKIIKVIAGLLIKYYNQYKILYDTKELISNLYNEEKKEMLKKRKINLNNTTIDNIDINQTFAKLKPSGEKINNEYDNNIKDNNLNKVNYKNINKINNNIKDNNLNNIYNNINIINNNINDYNNTNKNLNIDNLISSKLNNQNKNEFKTDNNEYMEHYLKEGKDNLRNLNKENIEVKNEKKIDEKLNENSENSEETSSYFEEKYKQFSYCSYVGHKLSCKKKYQFYKIYDKFRTNILSEEQIIKDHIITYNLLKKEDISLNRQIYSLKEIIGKI